MKLKDSAGLDLDAGPSSDFSESGLQPLASTATTQGKNCAERTENTSKTCGHQKGSPCGGRAKPRNYRHQRVWCEGIVSFCPLVSPASWTTLLKWVVRVTNVGLCLCFQCCRVSGRACLGWDRTRSSLWNHHSCDPDAQEVTPKGTVSLMDWIKATVRSVYLEKGGCPFPPINAKRNTPDGAADGLCMQAIWCMQALWRPGYSPSDYVYYPDHGKCCGSGSPVARAPHVMLLQQNWRTVQEDLQNLLSTFPHGSYY